MKTMKKVGAVVLALCMCFALCCTAFAASSEDTQGSITINGAIANETYTIYQIFELTYTDDGTGAATGDSYSYKVCEGWEDFLKTQTVNVNGNGTALFTLTEGGYLSPDSLIFQYEDDANVVAALARAALAYATTEIKDEDTGESSPRITGTSVSYTYDGSTATLNPQGVATITEISVDDNGYVTGELTFSGLSLGYYLVGTSLGSLCMLDSTDPDAVVNEKNSTPTISKHVYNSDGETTDDNDHEDHENNGSTVTYELDVDHITGAVNLVIHDSQPSELEEDWDTFAPTVTLVDGETRAVLIADTDYVIHLTGTGDASDETCSDPTFDELHACTFEIDFTDYDFSNVSENAYIEVIYTATLNTEGDIYVDDVDEIDNWAVVTFGTSSASPIVEAEVYSFGFEIFKYTGESRQTAVAADQNDDGAQWAVYADLEPGKYYILSVHTTSGLTSASYVHDQADEGSEFEKDAEVSNQYDLGTLGVNSQLSRASYVTITEAGTYYFTHDEDGTTNYNNSYPWYFVPESVATTYASESLASASGVVQAQEGYFTINEETELPLADAEFEVTREVTVTDETTDETTNSTQTAYFLEETIYADDEETVLQHIYLLEGWLNEDESLPENSPYTTSVTSASDGMIYIEGLDTGTYTVTEIAAPDGYNLLDDSIYVTIWAEYDDDTGALGDHGVIWTLGEDGDEEGGVVNVLNNAGAELPGTGGMGVYIFYIVGGCLVVAAAVVLITRRRVNRAE